MQDLETIITESLAPRKKNSMTSRDQSGDNQAKTMTSTAHIDAENGNDEEIFEGLNVKGHARA